MEKSDAHTMEWLLTLSCLLSLPLSTFSFILSVHSTKRHLHILASHHEDQMMMNWEVEIPFEEGWYKRDFVCPVLATLHVANRSLLFSSSLLVDRAQLAPQIYFPKLFRELKGTEFSIVTRGGWVEMDVRNQRSGRDWDEENVENRTTRQQTDIPDLL